MAYQGDRAGISVCLSAAVLTSHIAKNFNDDKKTNKNTQETLVSISFLCDEGIHSFSSLS